MDPTRFDALSRAFSVAASRRGALAALAALAGFAGRPPVGPAQGTAPACPSCGACTTCQPDGACAEGCTPQCLATTLCGQAAGFKPWLALAARLAADGFAPAGVPEAAVLAGRAGRSVFWIRYAHGARPTEEAWLLFKTGGGTANEAAALLTTGGVVTHGLVFERRKVRRVGIAPSTDAAAAAGPKRSGRQIPPPADRCAGFCAVYCPIESAVSCAVVGLLCEVLKKKGAQFLCGVVGSNLACGAALPVEQCVERCNARCCPCPVEGGRCCRPPDACCPDDPSACCTCPERRRCTSSAVLPNQAVCCPTGQYCCKSRNVWSCCPEGTPCDPTWGCRLANFCPAGGARDQEPCPPGRTCCPGPQAFSCCTDQETCCDGVCCPPGEECGPNKRCRIRCEPDRTRCDGAQGSSCCTPEQACCDGFCCPPGERCGANMRCQRGA